MHTNIPNHEPGLLIMNSGNSQPTRPSLGSWLTYGLGTENQNLPGYVVLCPGKPVVGPQLWGNSFLPGIFQGCHINNSKLDPQSVIQHAHNSYLPPTVQRRQLDLLQNLNREHFETRAADNQLEARIESLEMAFRLQFAAQEGVRSETANRSQLACCTAPANSLTAVSWRGAWSNGASAWCRFTTAAVSLGRSR